MVGTRPGLAHPTFPVVQRGGPEATQLSAGSSRPSKRLTRWTARAADERRLIRRSGARGDRSRRCGCSWRDRGTIVAYRDAELGEHERHSTLSRGLAPHRREPRLAVARLAGRAVVVLELDEPHGGHEALPSAEVQVAAVPIA